MDKKVDRNNLKMKSHEEVKKKDVLERIAEMFPVEEDKRWLRNHDLNECPYCGDEMELRYCEGEHGYFRPTSKFYGVAKNADRISYVCLSCGASSPSIVPDITLFNELKVKNAVKKQIKLVNDDRERYENELDAVEEGYVDE